MSFRRASLEYLASKRTDPTLSASQLANIEGRIYNHLLPFFGDHTLDDVKAHVIADYRNQKLSGAASVALDQQGRPRAQSKLAPQTVVHHLHTLNAIFRYARLREWSSSNPLEHVRFPSVERPPVEPFDPMDVLQVLQLLPADAEGLFHVLLHLGLRFGEALGLRDQDLLLDAGIVQVRGALKREKDDQGRQRLTWVPKPKSKHGWREFRISEELAGYLCGLVDVVRTWPDLTGYGLIFRTPSGLPLNPDNFRNRVWLPAVCAAHVKRMTISELRRLIAAIPVSAVLPTTALRVGETLHLDAVLAARWDDYDAYSGTLRFVNNKGAGDAVVFPEDLREELARTRARTNRSDAVHGGPMFPGESARRTSRWGRDDYIRAVFRRGFRDADIDFDRRIHRLRHTYASAASLMGAELRRLQLLLGHSRYTQTMDLYVHYYRRHQAPVGDTMAFYGPEEQAH